MHSTKMHTKYTQLNEVVRQPRMDPVYQEPPQTYFPQPPETQPDMQDFPMTIASAEPQNQTTTLPNSELIVHQIPQQDLLNIDGAQVHMYQTQHAPSYVPWAMVPQMYTHPVANLPYFNGGAPSRQSAFVHPPPPFSTMQYTTQVYCSQPYEQQHPPQRQHRRRRHALNIIDPVTGNEILP